MIDWYDLQQCHVPDASVHDKSKGRVFKVSYGEPEPAEVVDLGSLGDEELVKEVSGIRFVIEGNAITIGPSNAWHARHVRRILQERGLAPEHRDLLRRLAFASNGSTRPLVKPSMLPGPLRLRNLWALHVTGGLEDEIVTRGLADEDPNIRAWTVRLAMEDKEPSDEQLARFTELAGTDPSPVVRLDLASALQRMPVEASARWAILEGLAMHAEDANDHNLPLMLWYALEPMAADDPSRALELASRSPIPPLLEFTVRRIGAIGTSEALAMLVDGLGRSQSNEARRTILDGINQALEGRRRVAMPEDWPTVSQDLLSSTDPEIRSEATALALTFGDVDARDALFDVMTDRSADPALRREALEALRGAKATELAGQLRHLIDDPELRGPALRGLAEYDDAEIPEAILDVYPELPLSERRDALNTLAARPFFAGKLLDAVGQGEVASGDFSADIIRQLRNLGDPSIDAQIAEVWGTVRETPADRAARIEQWKSILSTSPEQELDLAVGRAVFHETCAQCHTLFGEGGKVGPELTGSNRADLDYILSNILDPSALIGKDYQAQLVALADGRILTGIITNETPDAMTLATANETITVPVAEVEDRRVSDASMMPDDLLANLSEAEVRCLIAYLASPRQVPLPADQRSESSPATPTVPGGSDLD